MDRPTALFAILTLAILGLLYALAFRGARFLALERNFA